MSDSSEDKPKIIIDEDWKTQVEREKEELQRGKAKPQPAGKAAQPGGPLPPASFSMLLSTLATQAMISLGQIPNPLTGKPDTNLDQARHFIDMLGMLENKTANNRTPEESDLLEQLLHELRMAHVAIRGQPAAPVEPPGDRTAAAD